jgi:thiosulfate dehydrogenase (quinone) large subunit
MSFADPLTTPADQSPNRRAAATAASTARAGYGLTMLRICFGVILTINAILKWLPGYRETYLAQLKGAAAGQPHWLHGWFHFWITLQSGSPALWADLTGIAETAIAAVLVFGFARRPGYLFGALYMLLVWGVGEGFGGPYTSGATDVGTGIIYTVLFLVLFVCAPPAEQEHLSLDRILVARHPAWKRVADFGRAGRSRVLAQR